MFRTATNLATRLGDLIDDMLVGNPEEELLEWDGYDDEGIRAFGVSVWEDTPIEQHDQVDDDHVRGHRQAVTVSERQRRIGAVPPSIVFCASPVTVAARTQKRAS